MKTRVKGVHVQLTDELKDAVERLIFAKVSHLHQDEAMECEVHLVDDNGPKKGLDQECRVTVWIPGRPTIHLTETSEDMQKSIHLAADRLERLMVRELSKLRGEIYNSQTP